jgi:transglutaminase-like putative cysteine protease
MSLRFLLALMLFSCLAVTAQDYSAYTIPKEFTENANAVIRLDKTDILIKKRDAMNIKTFRVVTIFNEYGMRYMKVGEVFSENNSIKDVEVLIYNAAGVQVKKIKRKDFKEESLSEGTSISDDKFLGIDYTPVAYPFTIVYTSETETTNTAFLPQWSPLEGTFSSTLKSEFNITCPPDLGLKYKDYNFTDIKFSKQQTGNTLQLSAENITAMRSEDYSPALYKIKPYVLFGLEKFHLEGVDGEAANWASFGQWMYNNLLAGTDDLPVATQDKIKALVGTETDPLKKAKIVYKYVQSKTRYISIQLGIGGWKPMLAKDVDRLGYGDCKALSNYMRALLKTVGVDSYYTVIYGDNDRRDMREEFVSMQGNHIILAIPDATGKLTWLECTSQKAPFGFQGDFTDNRLALLVKPDGGQIVRTHVYETKGNSQNSIGNYTIAESGAISGEVHIASRGLQYDNRYYLESRSPEDLDKVYKSRFSNINNLKLTKKTLRNDTDNLQFTEDVFLEAESYCNKTGGRIMFAVNAFNQTAAVPQRYRSRKMPLEINTGFYDVDEIIISLPQGFSVEAKPDNITIAEKFGEYTTEYELVEPGKMRYKRSLLLNEGNYASTEYENYRLFMEKVARNDNAKVVLVKNQ